MLNVPEVFYLPYTTTKEGAELLTALRKQFTKYILELFDFYSESNQYIDLDFILENASINSYLKTLPETFRDWVKASLHETCIYYFLIV